MITPDGEVVRKGEPKRADDVLDYDAAVRLRRNGRTGTRVIDIRASIAQGGTLRGLWENMPQQVLKAFIHMKRVPGEIKVKSGRVFRMLRPLCVELPFKLSLHEKLDHLA